SARTRKSMARGQMASPVLSLAQEIRMTPSRLATVVALLFAGPVWGGPHAVDGPATVPAAAAGAIPWRFAGPWRGGWATVAAGVPNEPDVFYFGGAGGGVWKTDDAGRTWRGLMQHEQSSAV